MSRKQKATLEPLETSSLPLPPPSLVQDASLAPLGGWRAGQSVPGQLQGVETVKTHGGWGWGEFADLRAWKTLPRTPSVPGLISVLLNSGRGRGPSAKVGTEKTLRCAENWRLRGVRALARMGGCRGEGRAGSHVAADTPPSRHTAGLGPDPRGARSPFPKPRGLSRGPHCPLRSLRCNGQTRPSTCLKCAVQWLLAYYITDF